MSEILKAFCLCHGKFGPFLVRFNSDLIEVLSENVAATREIFREFFVTLYEYFCEAV
jgi:hypothetical protein